jgi:hypothetical protein
MLRELAVSELRYRPVLEALDGAGVLNLADRSSQPHSCPTRSPRRCRPGC